MLLPAILCQEVQHGQSNVSSLKSLEENAQYLQDKWDFAAWTIMEDKQILCNWFNWTKSG